MWVCGGGGGCGASPLRAGDPGVGERQVRCLSWIGFHMQQPAPMSNAIHTEQPRIRAYPANVTFVDLIRANKRKSALLIACMILLAVVLGAVFAAALNAYATGGELPNLLPS